MRQLKENTRAKHELPKIWKEAQEKKDHYFQRL